MFLNQIVNHAFGRWTAGVPDEYSRQITATAEVQLDRRSPREHPQRAVIPSGSLRGKDYIYEGPFSYRATMTAAGVVDDWRMWAFSGQAAYAFSVAHLGPFLVIAGTNDTINFDEGGAGLVATLTAGFYTGATLAVEVAAQLVAAGGTVNTCTFNGLTRLFTVTSAAGAFNISWTTSNAAGLLGYTADDTAALTYDSDVTAPATNNSCYRGHEGKRMSFSVAARCSVGANLLRVRIVGLDENYTIAAYLVNGRWQAAAGVNVFQLQTMWKVVGVNFEIPDTVRYFLWQVSNGTAGAQSIDIGRYWLPHPMWQMGGEEARP